MLEKVEALVMAGGHLDDCPSIPKWAIPIGDRLICELVVQALRESDLVDRVYLVADLPESSHLADLFDKVTPAGKTLAESLSNGTELLERSQKFLGATVDSPCLVGSAIDSFIVDCSVETKADVCYGYITKANMQAQYPEFPRTYGPIRRNGDYFPEMCASVSICMIERAAAGKVAKTIGEFYKRRKSPLALASLFGWWDLFQVLMGMYRLEQAEEKMSQMFKCRWKAVETADARVGVNVDKLKHHLLVQQGLAVK